MEKLRDEKMEASLWKSIIHLSWIELQKQYPDIHNDLQNGIITFLPKALKRISYDNLKEECVNRYDDEDIDNFYVYLSSNSFIKDLLENIECQVCYAMELYTQHGEKLQTLKEMLEFQNNYVEYNQVDSNDISGYDGDIEDNNKDNGDT